jgi:transcriptional repressor NrdR
MQIRRRRQCEACGSRFNTYETPEIKAPRIIKADGTREAFSENKLRTGMLRALEKRPVETREVERAIRSLLRQISTVEDSEIRSSLLGEWVMRELGKLDQVAYIRFASVYKRFEDVQAFRDVIERLEQSAPGDGDKRQISLLEPKPGAVGRRDK